MKPPPQHGRRIRSRLRLAAAALWLLSSAGSLPAQEIPAARDTLRFATFNVSLHRRSAGQLIRDLSGPDNTQAKRIAEIIQRVRPDVLLLNELDFDPRGEAVRVGTDCLCHEAGFQKIPMLRQHLLQRTEQHSLFSQTGCAVCRDGVAVHLTHMSAELRFVGQQSPDIGRPVRPAERPKIGRPEDPQIHTFEFFRIEFLLQKLFVGVIRSPPHPGDPLRFIPIRQKLFEHVPIETGAAGIKNGGHKNIRRKNMPETADGKTMKSGGVL